MSKERSTLYPNGVSNASPRSFSALTNMRINDSTKYITYFNNFLNYVPADWTVTEVGAATQVLTNVLGSALLITNDVNDDNSSFQQLVGEAFQFATNKEMWFKIRFQVADGTQCDAIAGIFVTDTTPLNVIDGIFFNSLDNARGIDLVFVKDNVQTQLLSIGQLGDATDIELAFHYDGIGTFTAYVDDELVRSSTDLTNVPDDELLTVSFGIQNGTGSANSMQIDNVLVILER